MNPCIYCQGELKILNRNTGSHRDRRTRYYAYCPKCKAKGPIKKTEDEAIASVNGFRINWGPQFLYELEHYLANIPDDDPNYWLVLSERCKYKSYLVKNEKK